MPNRLYASTTDGIFKSVDGGKNWRMVGYTGYSSPNALAIDPLAPNTLYAGTDNYMLKSVDGGITWATLDTGLKDVAIYGLAIDPADPDRLYIGTNHGLFYHLPIPSIHSNAVKRLATWLLHTAMPMARRLPARTHRVLARVTAV